MNYRAVAVAAVLIWALATGVSGAATPALFAEANAKYQAGDFKKAAELYRKLIGTGHTSSAAYYNLGNATLRLGQKGEALLYYERALRANPRDADLLWNIQVLRGALTDRIEDASSNPLWTPLQKVLHSVTLDESALLFSGCLGVLAALAFLGYLFPAARGVLGFFRRVTLLGLLVTGTLFGLKWWDAKDPYAVILDRETAAFYGPSDKETKAFILHEGAEGRILDESGDWVYISLRNKNTGWIRKNSCELV